MRVLLLTPPLVQINTPYPATSFLTGFLRLNGVDAHQADPSLEWILKIFSKPGLERISDVLSANSESSSVRFFRNALQDYLRTIDPVIRFLQGKDPTLAHRIAARTFLPEGPRFQVLSEEHLLPQAFGSLGVQDQAKHLASLYLDDRSDVIREGVDSHFGLSRYAEKLAASSPSFIPIDAKLKSKETVLDQMLREVMMEIWERVRPDLVGFTVPFPGNLYGALKCAQVLKEISPKLKVLLGGGYVNTELRDLTDPGIFQYVDFITYDDGEKPLLCLIEYLSGKRTRDRLFRTKVLSLGNGAEKIIETISDPTEHDVPQKDTGFPTTEGLPMGNYISMIEMLNPMHRFWSDLTWNKLTLAHGCYWKKCSFCDVTLDYIGRFEASPEELTLERMKRLINENGLTGFHFTDEAAPPKVLKRLSEKIRSDGLTVSWWGNIRFDKTFDRELVQLMADAGCVAVSGGLEVASDRLLKLMDKGVTVEQVARVSKTFRDHGILVHAYLMYGFPSETVQETIDSLERVRQLFQAGCLDSAFWHRFSATAHSPVGRKPQKYGIEISEEQHDLVFARNDLQFHDPTGVDHGLLGIGLRRALFNYMCGVGWKEDVRVWFPEAAERFRIPKPDVPKSLIDKALK